MKKIRYRACLCLALACALIPTLRGQSGDNPSAKTEYQNGKVVPLADLLAKQGTKFDTDAAPHWLALVTDDGKVLPLVKDAGSRMFFKDAKLLNRPMRLTGRILPKSPFLQVVGVHSYLKGKLHDVYYWCDICTIKGFEAGICDCCGGSMEFREPPAK